MPVVASVFRSLPKGPLFRHDQLKGVLSSSQEYLTYTETLPHIGEVAEWFTLSAKGCAS